MPSLVVSRMVCSRSGINFNQFYFIHESQFFMSKMSTYIIPIHTFSRYQRTRNCSNKREGYKCSGFYPFRHFLKMILFYPNIFTLRPGNNFFFVLIKMTDYATLRNTQQTADFTLDAERLRA